MDDITIEDELDSNDDFLSQSKRTNQLGRTWFLFDIFNKQLLVIVLLVVCFVIWLYRRRIRSNGNHQSQSEKIDRFDHVQRVREQQQKRYEEQASLHSQQKQNKVSSEKVESSHRMKYRSSDHNPLMGQSNRSQGDSCSWRPSSRRKPPIGG